MIETLKRLLKLGYELEIREGSNKNMRIVILDPKNRIQSCYDFDLYNFELLSIANNGILIKAINQMINEVEKA
jgi:hypothetical protein